MNFEQFIKEFFRFTSNQTGDYFDTTHIIIGSMVTLLTIFLGVFLGIRNSKKDESSKIKFILPFAIVMWFFSIAHMTMVVVRSGFGQLIECDLPLFLCDIQYFALIAICFAKGKLRKAGLDFCICLGILSFAMGVWLNAGTYGGTPWWASTYIYEMVVHAIPGGVSLYIIFSKLGGLRFKDIWVTFAILTAFEVIALVLDYANDSNYMFFLRDAGTPFFIFTSLANGILPLYSFFVWAGMTVYVLVFYGIWELVTFIKNHSKRTKTVSTNI